MLLMISYLDMPWGRPPSASVGDDVDGGHACLGGMVWNVLPDMGKPILTVDREARLNKMEGVI